MTQQLSCGVIIRPVSMRTVIMCPVIMRPVIIRSVIMSSVEIRHVIIELVGPTERLPEILVIALSGFAKFVSFPVPVVPFPSDFF